MRWIALRWRAEQLAATPRAALAWCALAYTPHVIWDGDVLLLEVARCARLWGGRRALLRHLIARLGADAAPAGCAQAASSLVALARVRLREPARSTGRSAGARAHAAAISGSSARAHRAPRYFPRVRDLPLSALAAAQPHRPVLQRLGCRTWGDLAALPRAGLARRFGAGLVRALDVAWGRVPDTYSWIALPERFDEALELPRRVDTAPALLWGGHRLLLLLQQWLQARNRGALALELAWTFDQLRLNGRELPPAQSVLLRTAEPAQSMEHIRRLLALRLERTTLLAPAHTLRLRVLETEPWQPPPGSLLVEEAPQGQARHLFCERVLARVGAGGIRWGLPVADHRPECRQGWSATGQGALPDARPAAAADAAWADALTPAWLLRPPRALSISPAGDPVYAGHPLRLLTGPCRVETGWWSGVLTAADEAPAARDYFIAQGGTPEVLLIYRQRPTAAHAPAVPTGWFLQGFYA